MNPESMTELLDWMRNDEVIHQIYVSRNVPRSPSAEMRESDWGLPEKSHQEPESRAEDQIEQLKYSHLATGYQKWKCSAASPENPKRHRESQGDDKSPPLARK
jgi:hypothetical protein